MRFATPFGYYELNPFPGCNQIVVSNHSFVSLKVRGQGIGKRQHAARLDHIRQLGYNYTICTVKASNEAQLRILTAANWKRLDEFYNTETENTVYIYGKVVDK